MQTLRISAGTTCVLALVLVFAGCGGGSADGGRGAHAGASGPTLKISVTDAPFPASFVASATVVINEVRVRDKEADAWETVFSGSRTIDLVPLTGGVAELLVEVPIDPGTYDEVRLLVDAGTVTLTQDAVVNDDEVFDVAGGDLLFPSGAQSGIKVKIDNDLVVTSELSADLTLDFDLSKSFVFNGPFTHAPGVRRVIFTPVVRATNSSTNGTVALDVLSDNATAGDPVDDFALAGATVRLFDAADAEVAMGLTDAAGHFETSVVPGTYRLAVEAAGHDDGEVAGVVVALANLTDAGDVTLEASETEITGVVLSDGASAADATDDTNVDGALVEAIVSGDVTATIVASATTDANGAFALAMLAPGTYDLTVSIDGWETQTLTGVQSVFPGLPGIAPVTLVALTRDLTGTITDDAAAPIAGVVVTVKNANGQVIATAAATGADGVYAVAGIPSGAHTLEADDAGTIAAKAVAVVGTDPATSQTEDIQFP